MEYYSFALVQIFTPPLDLHFLKAKVEATKVEQSKSSVAKVESVPLPVSAAAVSEQASKVNSHDSGPIGDIKLEASKHAANVLMPPPKNNVLKPMLMLNKMSKEDAELMQRSLKDFVKSQPERAKDLGVVRGRRRLDVDKYGASDGASSDSDSDDENDGKPKKLKSKFFRATEKERDELKSQAKAERRKRRAEEEAADPNR